SDSHPPAAAAWPRVPAHSFQAACASWARAPPPAACIIACRQRPRPRARRPRPLRSSRWSSNDLRRIQLLPWLLQNRGVLDGLIPLCDLIGHSRHIHPLLIGVPLLLVESDF